SSRTPCMLTRPKASVTVVKALIISRSPARRTSCNAHALSLPLDQATSAFDRFDINRSLRGGGAVWCAGSAFLPPDSSRRRSAARLLPPRADPSPTPHSPCPIGFRARPRRPATHGRLLAPPASCAHPHRRVSLPTSRPAQTPRRSIAWHGCA